jgi:hypothetical protein
MVEQDATAKAHLWQRLAGVRFCSRSAICHLSSVIREAPPFPFSLSLFTFHFSPHPPPSAVRLSSLCGFV